MTGPPMQWIRARLHQPLLTGAEASPYIEPLVWCLTIDFLMHGNRYFLLQLVLQTMGALCLANTIAGPQNSRLI